MNTERGIDTVVIGAGHSGLAISRRLQKSGTSHIVLERGRIGESWASQRWDSFFLNTINAINVLPDDEYEGDEPTGFPSRDEFVAYLRGYSDRHGLPVRENTEVTLVRAVDDGFEVQAGDERLLCRNVVLCSGDQNDPRLPAAAGALPADVVQIHAADYRSPSALPDGAVLVVGSGQSGVQVVEDLVDAGRKVFLSTSCVGRVPRRYRGRDVLEWFDAIGLAEQRPQDVQDPAELTARQPQISGTKGGHSLSAHQLARQGVTLLGRLRGVDGRTLRIGDDLLANVARGDEQVAVLRAGIDKFIEATGTDAPPPEPDPVDEPFDGLEAMAAIGEVDLDDAGIRSVVFCTGFGPRFDYLDPSLLGDGGRPRHSDGVCEIPGLYCLGFVWLRRRISGIVAGVDADAEHVAELIAERATD